MIMRIGWLLMLAASGLLVALSLTAPFLAHAGDRADASRNYALFTQFCHQIRQRSLSLYGEPLAVCARCFGIYAGLLVGTIVYPLLWKGGKTPPGWLLMAATTPAAVDGFTQLLLMRESSNSLRLASGLIFGFAIPYYIIPTMDNILATAFIRERR